MNSMNFDAMPAAVAPRGRIARPPQLGGAGAFMVISDIVMLAMAVLVATAFIHLVSLFGLETAIAGQNTDHLVRAAPILAIVLGFFFIRGHYSQRMGSWLVQRDVCVALGLGLLVDAYVAYSVAGADAKLAPLLGWAVAAPLIGLGRFGVRRMLIRADKWFIPTIVVGEPDHTDQAAATLRAQPDLGLQVVERMSMDELVKSLDETPEPENAPILVLAARSSDLQKTGMLVAELMRRKRVFYFAPPLHGLPVFSLQPQYFLSSDIALFSIRSNLVGAEAQTVKRAIDIAASLLLLILLSPLMLAVYALIRLEGAPATYAHRRVGRYGHEFDCLKYRTMVTNGPDVLERHFARNPAAHEEFETTRKLVDDPRVTRIGKFLRKSSIDELPQLINVLRGEMSLVGPRPIVQDEIALYKDDIEHYLAVRPGITGLWQVSGRSNTTFTRRVALDVWYVKNWTIWHDLIILILTPAAVLRSRETH